MWAWYWLHFVESRGPVLWRCVDVLRGPMSWKSVGLELWPCVDTCHGLPGHNASWSHVWTPTSSMWPRVLSASTLLVHAASKWERPDVLILSPPSVPTEKKENKKRKKKFFAKLFGNQSLTAIFASVPFAKRSEQIEFIDISEFVHSP